MCDQSRSHRELIRCFETSPQRSGAFLHTCFVVRLQTVDRAFHSYHHSGQSHEGAAIGKQIAKRDAWLGDLLASVAFAESSLACHSIFRCGQVPTILGPVSKTIKRNLASLPVPLLQRWIAQFPLEVSRACKESQVPSEHVLSMSVPPRGV